MQDKKKPSTYETTNEKVMTAFLIATYRGNMTLKICEEHLDELELLAETYGVKTVFKAACPARKIEASTYLTKGKLEEYKELVQELKVDMVIIDDEIAPAQQRNLETIFGIKVMDRTELIIGVFAQRAQTKEARLQIELAQTRYQYPRLKKMWSHLSRQAGTGSGGSGGMYLKGEGEKQIEIDRRLVRQKIDSLQSEINEVKLIRQTQRVNRKRNEIPVFAIIGYTNAGKSTLINALTNSEVFVENKLFATLDTTTRKYTLPNNQDILVIDTVGFIRKLPHLLVAAFKSTLEEAMHADFLIHLVDVSHPMAEEQAETTFEVLKELNVEDKPVVTVLNKVDKPGTASMCTKLRVKYPRTVPISALDKTGFEDLQQLMMQEVSKIRKNVKLRIPQSEYAIVNELLKQGKIKKQDYEENDVLLTVEIPSTYIGRVKKYLVEEKE
jgi:GTP-binding protein HflX